VGTVRRLASAAARSQGLGAVQEGRVCLAATEIATNAMKYARSGRVLVRLVEDDTRHGVELLAIDSGPGMTDARARMVDGYSTGGSLGGGLGAISRAADLFDIYSAAGRGTVLVARFWDAPAPPVTEGGFLVGAVAEAIGGESVSGDAWVAYQRGSRAVALVVDGLGHGPDAARASETAVRTFRQHHREPVEQIMAQIHDELRATRGAAVAMAEIDRDRGRLRFCGIGNVCSLILAAGKPIHLMSQYGIAGHQAPRITAFEAAWTEGASMVMHSDGLSERWDLGGYPDLRRHHPLLTAATISRDASRRPDDATVLVLRGVDGADPGA